MMDLPLTKISETTTTITLGWTPPAGAQGYVFYADSKRSSTLDGTRSQVKFAKGATTYRVQALGTLAEGTYPTIAPPPPASDYPARPTLNNPIHYYPTQSDSSSRTISPGGRDYIIHAPDYVLHQIPTTGSNHAMLNIQGGGNGYVEGPLRMKLNILQGTNGYGNGFGYGIYFTDCVGRFWADDVQIAGPGCSQGVVFFCNRTDAKPVAQFMRLHCNVMHPVWHKAKGAAAEVHSDAIQSYGGPYSLQLFDTTLVTCGTAFQMTVNQLGKPPIGSWISHRVNCRYVANPASDERPFQLAKYGGGVKWPWEQKDVWTVAGAYTSDNWASNSIEGWNPGGSYPVTGEAWHIGSRPEGDYVPLDPVLA